jgi:hypothetical protein
MSLLDMDLATSTPIEALALPSIPDAPPFTKLFSIELHISNQCLPAKNQQSDRKIQKSPKSQYPEITLITSKRAGSCCHHFQSLLTTLVLIQFTPSPF